MSSAAIIARALGGHRSADGFLCRCPLASHGKGAGDRNPSLFVKDGDKAPLFKCFAGCDARDIIGELRGRGLCPQGDGEVSVPIEAKPFIPDHTPDPEALALWHAATPIKGNSPQAAYLRSRGLTGQPPPSLRATTILHLGRYPFPAIVAAVQAPARPIISIQCTLLDQRGERKAAVAVPRRTVGAIGCGAVRLAAAADVLGLSEGWEKALAAMQLFGVPCWASLGAGRMHRVRVPDNVQELHIFADNDEPGRAGAERTAHEHRHRRVLLRFPPEGFKDWDDVTRDRTALQRGAA
jgi:putative DNA primase/helicase